LTGHSQNDYLPMIPELRSFFAERFVYRRILQSLFLRMRKQAFSFGFYLEEMVEGQQQEKTNTG
jgi:hypothetical protein